MSFIKSKFAISMPMVTLLSMATLFILSIPQIQGQESCDSNAGFKESAEGFVTVRRSTRRGAKNKAEILWQPTDMLTDPTRYKVAAAELEMRQDEEMIWEIADVDTKNHGKAIKWTVKVKPCKKYHFRIRVTGNEVTSDEACLVISATLDPLSKEEIRQSGYTPASPTGFIANVHSSSAMLSWKKSDCAESYEITYVEAGKPGDGIFVKTEEGNPTSVEIKNLEPCTRYETFIYAVLDGEYSETSTDFATEPRSDAANTLEVATNPDLDFVQVSWPTWKSVSCIDEYKLKACEIGSEECTVEETIQKSKSPFLSHKVTGLKACTDYTLHITPVFKKTDIEVKEVEFRTHSMGASQLDIARVGSEVQTAGSIFVNWDPVPCAAKYKVYQKEVGMDEWMIVAEIDASESTETTVNEVTPCTRYQFGISAVLIDADGNESETEITNGPEITSDLDANTPFRPPRLTTHAGDTNLDISWGHADCISSYIVKACPKTGAYSDCLEVAVSPVDNGDKMMSHTISDLTSCTEYDLHVIPVIEGKDVTFTAHPETVTTSNGAPEAPIFKVELKDGRSEASVTWEPVNCASAYKIYYKIGDEGATEEVEIASKSDKEKVFKNNLPCHTYSYSVTTMVNDDESPRQDDNWQNVEIPPNTELLPTIRMVDHDQGNVTLKIDLAAENERCNIAEYEVVYSDGKTCCQSKGDCKTKKVVKTPDELIDETDIVVSVGKEHETSTIYKARVKYTNEEWSREVSHGAESASLSNCGGDGGGEFPLIPIVVGVAVLALVVIVVTVLLIKRSKNRNFDPEKAENGNTKKNGSNQHQNLVNSDEEETQKLNDAHA